MLSSENQIIVTEYDTHVEFFFKNIVMTSLPDADIN